MVGNDRAGLAFGRRGHRGAIALQPARGNALAREIEAIAFHLLLLAVHEPDVVAKEEVQVLMAGARQLLLDRFELEKQVVPEGADQSQARVLFAAKFLDQRAQNGEGRRLLAALLFRKKRRQRLEPAVQPVVGQRKLLPMRILRQHRIQQPRNHPAPFIQRVKLHSPVVGHDFEWRAHRRDIPARVSPGILVSRGKINAAAAVEIVQ